jgi:hypothetical protein
LSDPALLQNDPEGTRETAERWRRIAQELDAAYARWEILEAASVSAAAAPGP